MEDVNKIHHSDFTGENVSQVLPGKFNISGQQPFGCAIEFDLQTGNARET